MGIISPEPSAAGDFWYAFLSILLEGAPYILLGTIISGFIHAYLPSGLLEKMLPKNRFAAVFVSGLMGAVLPVCECAIVPVVRRLVRKGMPVACGVAYMLAAPVINPVVVISTLYAFKGNDAAFMTVSRLLMAYIVAVVVGMVVLRVKSSSVLKDTVGEGEHVHDHSTLPGDQKLILAMRTAMRDFLDTGLYFTVGVLITAVFNTQLDQGHILAFAENDFLAVPAMMGLAFILSLCSTTDAFIVAPILVLSQVAKLAFLVFGPMMDVKLVFMYLTAFKKRFVVGVALGVFTVVAILCVPWAIISG